MTTKPGIKALRRSALAAALSMTLASGALLAQSSVGSIYGEAAGGKTVTIENLDTGTRRETTTDADGKFTFNQLPTGHYRITSDGVSRDVQVNVGTGTRVELVGSETQMDTIQVDGSAVNPIDVRSVESTTVFSQERIQRIPVARDITNVALLAPGTVKGDTGFGNLASFGGSSVAENGYYINGFDVTNIRNFVSYAALPFDAIAEQQIKTGGYGAEFGRSLGGVINLVTKRGSNEWKGGASVYWSPEALRENGKDVANRNLEAEATRYVYRSDDERDNLSFNVYGGGPIIEDRLFFFGLIEGQKVTRDDYYFEKSEAFSDEDPQALVKLDWNITDNHLLEVTGIYNKTQTERRLYQRAENRYAQEHEDLVDAYNEENGGNVVVAKYTGYLTDTFTLSAQAGRLENTSAYRTTVSDGADCPAAYDSRPAGNPLNFIGCWNESAFTVPDFAFGPDEDERQAYRIDAEWVLGDHFLRFGYDDEQFTSSHAGLTYSGGIYYRYLTARTGRVNGTDVPVNSEYVRVRQFQSSSSSYDVYNAAFYLEDTWQFNDNLMFYGGLRVESFDNRNGDGVSFVDAENLFAPRLGFSWDVNGDSSFKVFGNAGRYHIPVASNTNIRASGVEQLTEQFYFFTGIDPTTGAPTTLGSQIGGTNVNGSLVAPDPRTVASTNLDPMYQDEFILGAQWALNDIWTAGVRAIRREVKNGYDDFCSHDAITAYVQENGFPDYEGDTLASCMILNPGRSLDIGIDANYDGNLVDFSIPSSVLGIPSYKRSYNALELFWEANVSEQWFLQGSYTLAHSYGNIEGYVNSTLEQDDAGLTQDFDHPLFEDGAFGDLPNDRRHTIKVFGSYQLNEQWRFGGNVIIQSGRPVSCNGFVPFDSLDPDGSDVGTLALYGASSFYCVPADGQDTVLTQRGQYGRTPWTFALDVSAAYDPNWLEGLTLQVDVFNLFNTQRVTEYSETGDLSRNNETNPNFLNDVNYQSPRSVRLAARFEW
jgi:TonB dependent receptor/Carboxypeptidase regulatory-like domain